MAELEEKIKKELLKSGFPLQIFCQRCLLENGWDILEASEYYVSDADIKKEIDVTGIYSSPLDNKNFIDYELFIECKKSEDNPWVFFKDNYTPTPSIISSYICAKSNQWPNPFFLKGLHYEKVPSSSIYTMAFKKKKDNQIYEAVSSVILAYRLREDFLQKIWQGKKRKKDEIGTIIVSLLTILFDGKLYLANLSENDNLELSEIGHLIYCYRETKSGKSFHCSIDIVERKHFSSYLKTLKKDKDLISNFYKQGLVTTGIE